MMWAGEKRAIRRVVFDRDGGKCFWCSRVVRMLRLKRAPFPRDMATVDHIIPQCDGGGFETTNLVLSCYACNNDRSNVPAEAYLRIIALRAAREARA